MGLNLSEIILVIVVIVLVLGFGQLPAIAEAIGKFRRDALKPKTDGPQKGAVDITPEPAKGELSPEPAPDAADIQGPVEDAELIDPNQAQNANEQTNRR